MKISYSELKDSLILDDKFESVIDILVYIVVLGMSYGLITQSFLVASILIFGAGLLSVFKIYIYPKEKLEEIIKTSKDGNIMDKYLEYGPIIGPLRLVLFLFMLLTFVTFNMFAWQVFLAILVFTVISVSVIAKSKGIDLSKY